MKRLPVCANWVVCRKVRRYAIWRPYWRGAALPGAAKIDEAAVAPLLDELASCNEPAFTPSGRAVLIRITREELAKRF